MSNFVEGGLLQKSLGNPGLDKLVLEFWSIW